MSAIISPCWGALSDRYGRPPMFLPSGFSLFAAYVATALVQTPMQLLVLRAIQGLRSACILAAITVGTSSPPSWEIMSLCKRVQLAGQYGL